MYKLSQKLALLEITLFSILCFRNCARQCILKPLFQFIISLGDGLGRSEKRRRALGKGDGPKATVMGYLSIYKILLETPMKFCKLMSTQ